MQLQKVDCYNCGSAANEPYAEENGYRLVRCSDCGLLYVRMRPEDAAITQAHKAGQHEGERTLDITGSFNRQKLRKYHRVLSDFFDTEKSAQTVLRWLDVGCGHGEFLVALHEYFGPAVRARGIEPNKLKREAARRLSIDVAFFDLDQHKETYDFISLLNVYSHLPSPPETLGALRQLLSPGGELIIQTGDTANLRSEDHFRPLYLPDHLSFASERIVVDILKRLGFEIVAVRKYPILEQDVVTWLKEGIKLFLPGKVSHLHYLITNRKISNTDMFIRARLLA